jgi:hypothetical protein
MYEKFTQWLPLIIAFVAGSFTLYQIRLNNITNARIKWLENFKQLLSEFFSETAILQIKTGVSRGLDEKKVMHAGNEKINPIQNKITESILEHLKIIESKHDLIKLNLNPKEKLHQKFEGILDTYMDFFNKIPKQKTTEEYNDLIRIMGAYSDTLILLTRFMLKLEWEKTKRLYPSKMYYIKIGTGKKLLAEALELEILEKRKPAQ